MSGHKWKVKVNLYLTKNKKKMNTSYSANTDHAQTFPSFQRLKFLKNYNHDLSLFSSIS